MRLVALVGIVTGLTLGTAGPAGAAVLYEQLPTGTFNTRAWISHDYANDAMDSQAADDFAIGDGQAWTIQGVQVAGRSGTQTSGHSAGITLYADAGGTPGAAIFSQRGIAIPDCTPSAPCNFTASIAGAPRLDPGTYWISVQTAGEQDWFWHLHTPDASFGSPAVWQNPANGFAQAHACTTYRPLIECGGVAGDARDLVFALTGTLVDSRFSVLKFTAKRLKLFANLNLPAAGALAIGGKGVKRKTHQVSAGAHRLRVKLKPAMLERLRSGRKARLRVKLTFTATGGDAYKQVAKVKLVPGGGTRAFRIAT